MRRFLRLLRRLLAGVGFVVLLTAALVSGVVWLTLPPRSQQARIPGLSAPVDIGFDANGIPRIHAGSAADAAAALGFVHARDRLFQMEMMRRAASGRLSEIAGPGTLGYDRIMRTLGLRRQALASYQALPDEARGMLDAYARGVNAWIAEKGRFSAPEYLFLGTPEPWQSVDSLLWGETMGLWLSLNWRTELSRYALEPRLPQQKIYELWPVVQGDGKPYAGLTPTRQYADVASRLLEILPHFPKPFTEPATASNAWAVDGRHTATEHRCSPAIRTWRSGFPASGTWRGSRRRKASSWVPRHRACRSWCWATTGISPGASPPLAPMCRTCSSRRNRATACTRPRMALAHSPLAKSGSRFAGRRTIY